MSFADFDDTDTGTPLGSATDEDEADRRAALVLAEHSLAGLFDQPEFHLQVATGLAASINEYLAGQDAHRDTMPAHVADNTVQTPLFENLLHEITSSPCAWGWLG